MAKKKKDDPTGPESNNSGAQGPSDPSPPQQGAPWQGGPQGPGPWQGQPGQWQGQPGWQGGPQGDPSQWQGGPQGPGQWQGQPGQGQQGPWQGQPPQGDPSQWQGQPGQWQGQPGQGQPGQGQPGQWQGGPQGPGQWQGQPGQWQGGPQGPGQWQGQPGQGQQGPWQGQPPQGDPSQWQGQPGQWQGQPGWQGGPQGDPSQWQGGPQGPGQWQGDPSQTGPVPPVASQPTAQEPAIPGASDANAATGPFTAGPPAAGQPAAPPATTPQPAPVVHFVGGEPPRKGNGGLVGLLVTLLIFLVASATAAALLFTGIIPSPFVGEAGAPAATGTPTRVYLAPAGAVGDGAVFDRPVAAAPDPSIAQPADSEIAQDAGTANARVVVGNEHGIYGLGTGMCVSHNYWVPDIAADQGLVGALSSVYLADSTIPWSGEITVDTITDFFDFLTARILVNDTLVEYYNYTNGAFEPVPAVLQKGTAVLVDRLGVPRLRCMSGNPLGIPATDILPVYSGASWADFLPESVVTVSPAEEQQAGNMVRVPATVTGELAISRVSYCAFPTDISSCSAPAPDPEPTAPLEPAGADVPVPSSVECPSQNALDWETTTDRVGFVLVNSSSEPRYIFSSRSPGSDGLCAADYWTSLRSGTTFSNSINDWTPLSEQTARGFVMTITDASGTILDTFVLSEDNNTIIVN